MKKIEISARKKYAQGDTEILQRSVLERKVRNGTEVRWDIRKGYGISGVDSSAKWTGQVSVCTVSVVSGIDKSSGERISFMTHHMPSLTVTNPNGNIHAHRSEYWDRVDDSLATIMKQVDPQTLTISVCGGMISEAIGKTFGQDSMVSVVLTAKHMRSKILRDSGVAVNPVVIAAPNMSSWPKGISNNDCVLFYDTPTDSYELVRDIDQHPYEIEPIPLRQYIATLKQFPDITL